MKRNCKRKAYIVSREVEIAGEGFVTAGIRAGEAPGLLAMTMSAIAVRVVLAVAIVPRQGLFALVCARRSRGGRARVLAARLLGSLAKYAELLLLLIGRIGDGSISHSCLDLEVAACDRRLLDVPGVRRWSRGVLVVQSGVTCRRRRSR